MKINRHILDNGLRLVHSQDESTQMVALNILYNVGARDEDPEHTGFAHLFEHLMFGGSVSASSHFCSAERQYRFPLAYGGQRTPTAQWTATAAGAAVLGAEGASDVCLTHVLFGKMVELGVKDANNMGAAMAPAACDTLSCLLREMGAKPEVPYRRRI